MTGLGYQQQDLETLPPGVAEAARYNSSPKGSHPAGRPGRQGSQHLRFRGEGPI